MLLLITALLAGPALANEDGTEIHVQAAALRADGARQLAASARLVGEKDAYLGVEARVDPRHCWMGRVGLGFDVLGGGKWDLKLGLFLGGTGNGLERDGGFITGTEVALGAEIGRLYGQYRWLGGIGGSDLAQLHSENDLTVGFRVIDELRVYGQVIRARGGSFDERRAMGLGVAWRF
ncbi:MAG: hypothetical protein JRJ84_02885 [Deltaproteobacteria bacterium]|nr:hypothetical protein [Deltaproteobacteria bacterium]